MNCQEALNLLYDIVDNEASEVDVQNVREHLKNCEDCDGVYRLEQTVDELLRARLENPLATPQLASLKTKVLGQLDEIDCE
ncbi:MAG: zf-HC2 domain-containing protein [candidate division Zixibacteria bacterium]|nr:zf-HC2 domain-containing protein [candidate division Zixibacteria bacterium]